MMFGTPLLLLIASTPYGEKYSKSSRNADLHGKTMGLFEKPGMAALVLFKIPNETAHEVPIGTSAVPLSHLDIELANPTGH